MIPSLFLAHPLFMSMQALKGNSHIRKNVVINFDIAVFHCLIKNKDFSSLFRFVLL